MQGGQEARVEEEAADVGVGVIQGGCDLADVDEAKDD